eukprot:GHVQ01003678.1.p1 GENE.GHVQ01003678.1~~GHVQ01003678.1.p1  ORF type:complete len:434 (+),score=25.67 GHVQ01003678.1:179-1303(+)
MSSSPINGHLRKFHVGVLGATGTVGQRFVQLLENHPWFAVSVLAASHRSAGKTYGTAVAWKLEGEAPYQDMVVEDCENVATIAALSDLVFSGLDASVAGDIEEAFADAGVPVFSNAKNHRMDKFVPILIPFVNSDHLEVVQQQPSFRKSGGYIVTNSNCASTGLCIALKPLQDSFGLKSMFVATLQAISGAGYPGLPSLDILDNVIPGISGEEEKIETEPNKILGVNTGLQGITPAGINCSASTHRVPVTDGHVVSLSLSLQHPPSKEDETKLVESIKNALMQHSLHPDVLKLPSCPKKHLHVTEAPDRPQPRLDRTAGKGMTTVVGRIRPCPLLDVRLTILSHNTVIGAAGGSLLNAELAASRALIKRRCLPK